MTRKTCNYQKNFVDEIFEFKGLWDMPSKCGLKIVEQKNKTIVIITDLYHENPGTSVTEFCAELATIIVNEKQLNPEKAVFIHHSPDMGSKYEFFTESFELIKFDLQNNQFTNPKWEEISKRQVEEIVNFK